jgi:hypothetical protein
VYDINLNMANFTISQPNKKRDDEIKIQKNRYKKEVVFAFAA